MRKKPMLLAAAALVTAIGIGGIGMVSAQSQNSHETNLIDKLVAKFNLNRSEVQAVFDEQHQQLETERLANIKERLDQAVADGKITQAQEDQIVAKQKELQEYRESIKGKTENERQQLMRQKTDELKTWAKENNIPTHFVKLFGHHGHHTMGGHGSNDNLKGGMSL